MKGAVLLSFPVSKSRGSAYLHCASTEFDCGIRAVEPRLYAWLQVYWRGMLIQAHQQCSRSLSSVFTYQQLHRHTHTHKRAFCALPSVFLRIIRRKIDSWLEPIKKKRKKEKKCPSNQWRMIEIKLHSLKSKDKINISGQVFSFVVKMFWCFALKWSFYFRTFRDFLFPAGGWKKAFTN